MIDGDDVDDAWLLAAMTGGGFGLFALIVLIVVTLAYRENRDECAHKRCPGGGEPRLMDHECLCVEKAR